MDKAILRIEVVASLLDCYSEADDTMEQSVVMGASIILHEALDALKDAEPTTAEDA